MGDKRYILIFMGGFITLAPISFNLQIGSGTSSCHYSYNHKGVMNNIRSRSFWLSIGLITADGLFFGLTNPVKVASILLIVGFGLLMLTAYWLFYNLQKALAFCAPWLSRQRRLSLTITSGIAALLALQSIGQLTARDSLLIPLAALALYAYFGYGKHASADS